MTRKFLITDGEAVREIQSEEILRGAAALMAQRFRRGTQVPKAPGSPGAFSGLGWGALPYEVFGMLLLDLCGALRYVVLRQFGIEFDDGAYGRTQH